MATALAYEIDADSSVPISDRARVAKDELHYYCFPGDVTFRIDDADFSTPTWRWVPVLDFAVCMSTIVARLEPGDEDTFEFTESEALIRFRRIGNRVVVSASYVDDTASVDYDDLLEATSTFLDETATRLLERYPRLALNKAFLDDVKRVGEPDQRGV